MPSSAAIPGLNSYTVQAGSRHIFVSETGQGHPLLMLHGGGPGASGMSNYSRNVTALAQHFRVLIVDMPGYGQSSKGLERSDPFGDLAQSMLELLDALAIPTTHVIGNSLGGACALRMALEAPQRISAMVLMGPGGINTTRSLPTPGLKLLLNYYNGAGPTLGKLSQFIREYLVYDASQVSDAMIEERYRASLDPQVIAAPPLRRPNSLKAALRMDFSRDPRLAQCQVPTLVLWGAEDKVNRPSGGETLRKALANCDLYLFSKTGHWVQWERAAQFNALSAAFLLQYTPA
ncbi:alpha/beta fold hydrolase [Pseudomonas sp. 5P_3.1_Bac2]|uniref:alpha/beta fold hydrolase n=1 Tax=Pseudomonas sp. 5P_3.1_Bac2 TaxID=2971617 RepID=UPI0021C6BA4E|nr:alpha/beta fold hydrolase [Pseudomonas sp. 5P_3.1_Bac2]MCU1718714.1 alpha/beta fold hydrolase [Pseudomonas sp. 5P_3.1_Bac2]